MPRISDQELKDYIAAYEEAWNSPEISPGVVEDPDPETAATVEHVAHNAMLDLLYDLVDARELLAAFPDPLAPSAHDQPPIDHWPLADLPEFMHTTQIAETFGISREHVQRARVTGRLRAVRFGNGWFTPRADALAYALATAGTPAPPGPFDPISARIRLKAWMLEDDARLPWRPNIRDYHERKRVEASRNLEQPFDADHSSLPIDQTPWYLG